MVRAPQPFQGARGRELFVLIGILLNFSGWVLAQTPWLDICVAEEYATYKNDLCPDVFFVSTIAFNPLYPKIVSNITLIIQPSTTFDSSTAKLQLVRLRLPGFEPIGALSSANALQRNLLVTAGNPTAVGQDPTLSYNTVLNPLFQPVAAYDTQSGVLTLQVAPGKSLQKDVDTEVVICCMRLPAASAADNPVYRIRGPGLIGTAEFGGIPDEPVKSSAYIDPGFQWQFLQIQFSPPQSMHTTVVALTLRSANDLGGRCRIVLHLPTLSRASNTSGVIQFSTSGSEDGTDWMLFADEALWNNDASTITWFIRQGQVLPKGRQVTLKTVQGDFVLPVQVPANWPELTVEARSFDNVDEIIRPTPVTQATAVPHVRMFVYSELKYLVNRPNVKTNVQLILQTNRPMFAGTSIYVRLSGFRADVIEVPLIGSNKVHFQGQKALFRLAENIIQLDINKTLYSNENRVLLEFGDLYLPPALYGNDTSLLIWNSDPSAPRQPVMRSPQVGGGAKTFLRSQIAFDPSEPLMPANISFIIQPSITFYQGDQIVLHLYGFTCALSRIPLLGPDAFRVEGSTADWNGGAYTLILTVATNRVVRHQEPFRVSIGLDTNFRLPDKLSKNDGILRIEGAGALILPEAMKKVPAIGDEKFVIDSRIEFEPVDQSETPVARISISFVLNCDVLPNSTIFMKLGGLLRSPPNTPIGVQSAYRSGVITLSGSNAPLFVGGVGIWDQDAVTLSVQIISTVQVNSGEEVRFFIERDQYFTLPFAAYPNDPSFRLSIPEAGIPERQFKFSTRVNQVIKAFTLSEIYYGDRGSVAYPNTVVEVNFRFGANVDLPGGSIVRIRLPGFTSPYSSIELTPPAVPINGENDLSEDIPFAIWDQLNFTMDLVVPKGRTLYRQLLQVFRVKEAVGFRLPGTELQPNDLSLTISCIQNVIIFTAPIQISPRVVDRTFKISEFSYRPPQKDTIFLFMIRLQATVNITDKTNINIFLPGFRNSLSKLNIQLMGPGRGFFSASMGQWNETTATLTMTVPRNSPIPAFTVLDLRIEESQGFILPAALKANDTRLLISSVNNIQPEPVKVSPMVGNGPFSGHLFCMLQYERGVRSPDPICTAAVDCDPPLTDPCNPIELKRCQCNPRVDQVLPLVIQGFILQETDSIYFLPQSELCALGAAGLAVRNPFGSPPKGVVSEGQDTLTFSGIASTDTGYFRICIQSVDGSTFDVGNVVVRPSCETGQVLVGGVCVDNCPETKIPIAGHCRRDPLAIKALEAQPYMLAVRMSEPFASTGNIASRPSDDAERRYFIYRYRYEIAKVLNADPNRIEVASLSNGSVIVNTVFRTVGDETAIAASTERSPIGLISLLQALQSDTSSQLYQSVFLKHVDRSYRPAPIAVRLCPDGAHRVYCPYTGGITTTSGALTWLVLGTLAVPVLLGVLLLGAWRIDFDAPPSVNEEVLEKIRRDPRLVDPQLQAEYARSWLEGRFMGEEWQRARHAKFLALLN